MAADAAELIVHVPDGQLRAGGRQPADHDLTALLVHPADVDLGQPGLHFPRFPLTYVR